jgi:hypothetical protein
MLGLILHAIPDDGMSHIVSFDDGKSFTCKLKTKKYWCYERKRYLPALVDTIAVATDVSIALSVVLSVVLSVTVDVAVAVVVTADVTTTVEGGL